MNVPVPRCARQWQTDGPEVTQFHTCVRPPHGSHEPALHLCKCGATSDT